MTMGSSIEQMRIDGVSKIVSENGKTLDHTNERPS